MLSLAGVKDSREIAWDYTLTAQMNVLYYQRKVGWWTSWDLGLRILSGVAASGTLLTFLRTTQFLGTDFATALGAVAVLGSIVGAALKIPEKVSALGVILAEYTAHAAAFERLYQFGGSEEDLKAALDAFTETEKREAKDHPLVDEALLAKSQEKILERLRNAA